MYKHYTRYNAQKMMQGHISGATYKLLNLLKYYYKQRFLTFSSEIELLKISLKSSYQTKDSQVETKDMVHW